MRLTAKVANELANQYAVSSALFEQCLRLLVYLASAVPNEPASWSTFVNKNLKNLLESARHDDLLRTIVGLIDRHVRNAFAHGVPYSRFATGALR